MWKGSEKMQEDVENKSVNLAVQTTKLAVRYLIRGLYKAYLMKCKTVDGYINSDPTGKQTVKQLIGQGQGVSSMEVGDSGIRGFKRIANKYGVDFAIVKDKDVDPPRYTVFFKAKDADAITQVLKEYASKQTKREKKAEKERPSILQKLQKFKEKVASMPKKSKEKRKEVVR